MLLARVLAGRPDLDDLSAGLIADAFEGLGHRYDFREGNVNEALYLFRYRYGVPILPLGYFGK